MDYMFAFRYARAVSVAALLVAATATAFAVASSSKPRAHRHSTHRGRAVTTASVPDAIGRAYGVFRRSATAQDIPPHGTGVDASRKSETTPDNSDVYLLVRSGRGDLCVTVLANARGMGYEGCGDAAAASTKPVIATLRNSNGPDLVSGPAPDGVTSVTIDSTDGELTTAPVVNNAYSATVPGDFESLSFNWSDGHHTDQG